MDLATHLINKSRYDRKSASSQSSNRTTSAHINVNSIVDYIYECTIYDFRKCLNDVCRGDYTLDYTSSTVRDFNGELVTNYQKQMKKKL